MGDETDAHLFRYALPGWRAWFVAGYAGMMDLDLRDFHREQFRERLTTAVSNLTDIRRSYRLHGDIDELLEHADDVVVGLFVSACTVARHASEDDQAALEEMLAERGLTNWFKILCMDLPALWREGAKYPPQETFLVLNQHLRRLFVLGAIFFWDDNGALRVEVPYWSDIDWMHANAASMTAGSEGNHDDGQ